MSCRTVQCFVLFALIFLVSGAPDQFDPGDLSKSGGYWRLVESTVKYLKECGRLDKIIEVEEIIEVDQHKDAIIRWSFDMIKCRTSDAKKLGLVMDYKSANTLQLRSAELTWWIDGNGQLQIKNLLTTPLDVNCYTFQYVVKSDQIQSKPVVKADAAADAAGDQQGEPQGGGVEEEGQVVDSGLAAWKVGLLILMVAAAAGGLFFWQRAKQRPQALSGGLNR